MFLEDLRVTAGHHQQGAIESLGLAPQNRGLQIVPVVWHNMPGQLSTFLNAHGAHGHHRGAVQRAEGINHAGCHAPITQHRDHCVAALGGTLQLLDGGCTLLQERCKTCGVPVPDMNLQTHIQQSLGDGRAEESCSQDSH